MIKFILIFLFIIPFVISCSDEDMSTTPKIKDNFIAKVISPYFYWTTYTYYDPLYNQYFTRCTPEYSFTFSNYNFELIYSRTIISSGTYLNTITVYEGGIYRTSVSWTNSDNQYKPRTILTPFFNLNNQSLRLSIYIQEFYIPMQAYSEPYSVRVSISNGR